MNSARPLVTLKCKLGELDALCNLRSETDAQVRLMIELLDSVKPDGKLLPALVHAALRVAEFGQTLWLDTTWLTSASPLSHQPGGVLEYLDNMIESELLENYGCHAPELAGLVPVVSIDASDDELRRVRLLVDHRERDVVIRIRRPVTPAQALVDRVRRITQLTAPPDGRVHAVLDIGFVEAVRTEHINAVTKSTAVLSDLLGPRSTTVLAGSIPKNRTDYGTIERVRAEVMLWYKVRQSGTNDVGYGDYGVTHPKPPESGVRARNPYPYLCYTVPRKTVVLRRKLETGDAPAKMFTDLVEELVERTDFAGPDYSWGDHELTQCRLTGGQAAGSVTKWVAMATSHHLGHVSRRTAADL